MNSGAAWAWRAARAAVMWVSTRSKQLLWRVLMATG